ncbi:MAG: (d)CMP kinase [Actinobacteria bacterium]|nr:(d)CMP kinase [Actinomycetota bacterium]
MSVIVAIDGPSGSGKSSTSRLVASRLGARHVDTGAMYRAMTWWMLSQAVDVNDAAAVARRCGEPVITVSDDPEGPYVSVNGVDVTADIRGCAVGEAVSRVSAVPEVRSQLVAIQRGIVAEARAEGEGVVMEGRDIGTVVLPDADVKVYLTADASARAERRAREQMGSSEVDGNAIRATEEHLLSRDAVDSTRAVSPLQAAEDALLIDGTLLSLDEVADQILARVADRSP